MTKPATRPLAFCSALLAAFTAHAAGRPAEPLGFALVGDYNYGPPGGKEWQESERLIAAVNRSGVRFALHLGDIQAGNMECTDEIVRANRAQFRRFRMPLVYLFGDNEWTDCHRYAAQNPRSAFIDPLERLDHLRRVFYSDNSAQGGGRLRLTRQADATANPEYRRFVENVRWEAAGVVFVGVNVPGGNNNHSGGPDSPQTVKVPGQDAEWALRNAAVLDWLRESFRRAEAANARAVFIAWQGNPDLENLRTELPHYDSNGFRELNANLAALAEAFRRPVVLAHGDSHHGFRVDHPLPLPNLLRVENYGHPHTHWTRVTVLPDRKGLAMFRFEGMRVPGNP